MAHQSIVEIYSKSINSVLYITLNARKSIANIWKAFFRIEKCVNQITKLVQIGFVKNSNF